MNRKILILYEKTVLYLDLQKLRFTEKRIFSSTMWNWFKTLPVPSGQYRNNWYFSRVSMLISMISNSWYRYRATLVENKRARVDDGSKCCARLTSLHSPAFSKAPSKSLNLLKISNLRGLKLLLFCTHRLVFRWNFVQHKPSVVKVYTFVSFVSLIYSDILLSFLCRMEKGKIYDSSGSGGAFSIR